MNAGRGVVVVGAGQAGVQLAAALREAGLAGPLTLVGEETELPYHRPPLSKEYLAGKVSRDDVVLRGESFYEDRDIDLLAGRCARAVDRSRRTVTLDDGSVLPYDHLVLATGTRPRPLRIPGNDLDGVLNLRTRADAQELRERLASARRVVVIGAGFIGLEFAAACQAAGLCPVVLDIADQVMGRAVSGPTASFFEDRHGMRGSRFLMGCGPAELLGGNGRVVGVRTTDGVTVPADLVVTGIGVLPNTELASTAGLATDNGIAVDEYLATADPYVSAIGDCASFPAPHGSGRIRLESVQNASDQARCLAARLTGAAHPYEAPPWFWSYQGDLRLQIAGLSSGHDRTVVCGERQAGKFSVFCFRGSTLVAVESVNRPADHMAARRLLADGLDLTPDEVAASGFSLRDRAARKAVA
ncbi:FAD-dependent oxidoreductase [Streptomyces sp. NPDC008137]|uniref:NAD(P)/FAD-dependent oxidoreductase n=1 Tax=Streptomyces sp. NPDC008137 TaxID=3364813 RepID=UPI0036E67353